MNRRNAIKRTAMMLGYAATASSVVAIMNGCKADPKSMGDANITAWKPEFLSENSAKVIGQLAECIIPKTDTGGAIDAGVHSFIDQYLKNTVSEEDQKLFNTALAGFNQDFESKNGKDFLSANQDERNAFLTDFEKEAEAAKKANPDQPTFWHSFKELTIMGYFTSEVGMKQALVFDPIPGEYKACIPVEEAGGMWAH